MLTSLFFSGFSTQNGESYQQFGSDSFTDSNGKIITEHSNDASVVWTLQNGLSVTTHATINNNRLYSLDVNNTYTSNFIPNNADYEVYGKFYKFTNGTAGITARASTSANTYYSLRYDGIGWQINRVLNGVAAQIGAAYLDDWADGTEREVVLWLQGAIIKAFVNGTERITTADFLITEAGRGGITLRTPATTTTGIHLDTFQVRQQALNPSVLLVNDSFTDTNGVLLKNHTTDTGQGWIRTQSDTPYSDISNPIIHNNNIVVTSTNQRWRFNNNLTENDYEILFSATRVSNDATTVVFITGRSRGTVGGTANQYLLRHTIATGQWILSRHVDGVFGDNLATYNDAGFTSGVTRRGRFVFKGSSVQVFIDDIIAISYTNTTALTGDTFGIESGVSGTPATTTTGLHIERLSLNGIVKTGYDNLYDNFNSPNNTLLINHLSSESGYKWIAQASPPFTQAKILNNRVVSNSGATYKLDYTMQTPNYEVEGNFFVVGTNGIYGVTARAAENQSFTLYRFQWRDNNEWSLRKYVSANETILATVAGTLTIGTIVKVTLRCDGNTISCFVNGGTPIITLVDTDITNAGRAGYSCAFGAIDTQGLHLESFITRAL